MNDKNLPQTREDQDISTDHIPPTAPYLMPNDWAPKYAGNGRHTRITKRIANHILHDYANSAEPVEAIMKKVGLCRNRFFSWQAVYPEFADACARARRHRAHSMVEKGAEDFANVEKRLDDPDEDPRKLHVRHNIVRARSEYMLKLAGKYNNLYADKQELHVRSVSVVASAKLSPTKAVDDISELLGAD